MCLRGRLLAGGEGQQREPSGHVGLGFADAVGDLGVGGFVGAFESGDGSCFFDGVEVEALGVLHDHGGQDIVGVHVVADQDGDGVEACLAGGGVAPVAHDDDQLLVVITAGDDGLEDPDVADAVGELGEVSEVVADVVGVGVEVVEAEFGKRGVGGHGELVAWLVGCLGEDVGGATQGRWSGPSVGVRDGFDLVDGEVLA